jgi:uncharacterized protein (DUF2236 family)
MTALNELSREAILLAGGGRAILLQFINPAVGTGVVRHSNFADHALRRLHGTLSFVYAVAAGTDDDVRAVRARVGAAHAPVRGEGYSAVDPDLQLWVAATLYESAVLIHDLVLGPADDGPAGDELADRMYADAASLGTALQMPADLWPADRAAFKIYWDAELAKAEASPEVQAVARTLLDPHHLPFVLRGWFPLIRRLSVGLLPPGIAEILGLEFTERDAVKLQRDLRRIARWYPRLPGFVRFAPQRYYLRQLRRSYKNPN